ncbi:hypothetical protein E2R53_13850 [Peribacillus frigoritolerans]|nr:hypothetical protein E2R53_13850 [Peribacillus frigoritolerans]
MYIFTPANVSFADEREIDEDLIEIGEFVDNPVDDSNLIEGIDYDIETTTIYFDDIDDNNTQSTIDYLNSLRDTPTTPVKPILTVTDQTNDNLITPSMVVMPGPKHKTTDVKYIKETVGTKTLWKTSGQPGITIGLNFTKMTTATVSKTYGASFSDLSANINFTIGKTYSVSSTGTYTVPKTHKGKAVSKAEVTGHPIYKKYTMKVHEKNNILYRYDYKGIAYAYKPIGIDIQYKHYYK